MRILVSWLLKRAKQKKSNRTENNSNKQIVKYKNRNRIVMFLFKQIIRNTGKIVHNKFRLVINKKNGKINKIENGKNPFYRFKTLYIHIFFQLQLINSSQQDKKI